MTRTAGRKPKAEEAVTEPGGTAAGVTVAGVTAEPEARKPDPRDSSLFVGSTEKTFQILHAFDGPHRQMPLSEIARAANLDRSAAQRLVYTLEVLGYLRRVHGTRNYALTPKLLQFSYNYLRANELIEKAFPYLLDISRSVGETTNLQELDGAEIVFVARFPGKHLVNIEFMVGSRLPAYYTASGTAILSRLSEEEREDILARTDLRPLTPYTVCDPDRLRARVREAGEKGYALLINETVMGDISVGAAITDEHGRAVAGLSISVPATRWTPEQVEQELARHVQVAAASISVHKFGSYSR
ncbi:helix-turn-helix domain-containing protein [Azospirillum melinis]|uniref:Helix-turn-helix domain-containing protein n=1 Tax=Azospirillum melinis TaxID=328839 RepID=A0ABX2KFT1_9PROT|nr:IclR family transcriptional regulator C-terminal domain-containing protein [Azospirillum melinis]MBP2310036.1 DNA-binding IclR family transcriptional regulator [Azospirillum melinis]NUB01558.1 helix-turn-helix domain-containing protein [Azospirillum melinis]